MKHMPWTDPEIERLTKLWAGPDSTKAIGKKLNRTADTIASKAHRLGLPARPSPIKASGNPWTSDEDEKFRRLRDTGHTEKQIMALLGRPKSALQRRAQELNLPRVGAKRHGLSTATMPRMPAHRGSPDKARAMRNAHATPRTARADAPEDETSAPERQAPPPNPGCKWPLWSHGERPAFGEHRFCGKPLRQPGKPWCIECHAVAHAKQEVEAA